jgi:predicted metalloendopeptidase
MERWLGSLIAWVIFAACSGDDHPPESKADPAIEPSPELVESVVSAMDLTADPCQDFYRYACGGWIDDTELDPDETRRSRSFTLARDSVKERLDTIVTEAVEAVDTDPDLERLRVYFGSCADEEAIEQAGVTPLEPYFVQIEGITDLRRTIRRTSTTDRSARSWGTS